MHCVHPEEISACQSRGRGATYAVSDAIPSRSSLAVVLSRARFLARLRLSVGRGRGAFGERDLVREGDGRC